jgi:hypothetical protein
MIALVSLDFGGAGSMCGIGKGVPMDAHLVEATIKSYLTEIRNRLDKAAKSLSTSSSSSMRQQRCSMPQV